MGIPLPALNIKPIDAPDPLSQYGKVLSLKSMLAQQALQQQLAPLQVQEAKRQGEMADINLQNQRSLQGAFARPAGPAAAPSPDAAPAPDANNTGIGGNPADAPQPSVGPAAPAARPEAPLDYDQLADRLAGAGPLGIAASKNIRDLQKLGDEHTQGLQKVEEGRANILGYAAASALGSLKSGVDPHIVLPSILSNLQRTDPTLAARVQSDLRQSMQQQGPQGAMSLLQEYVAKSPDKDKLQNSLDVARIRANTQKEGEIPLNSDELSRANTSYEARYQVLHPNAKVPTQYQLPAGSTQKDAATTTQQLQQLEQAESTRAQQAAVNSARDQAAMARMDAATARSYQFHAGEMDKLRLPVDNTVQRLSRLRDTLAQANPQADALIAPELISVMAGGQGSGVRVTEAEIGSVIGGRSAWQNLKADIQHWKTDPDAARKITPEQDQMIRNLVQTVAAKVEEKQAILQEARQNLATATDTLTHRKIFTDMTKRLNMVDSGSAAQDKTGASKSAAGSGWGAQFGGVQIQPGGKQ